MFWVFNWGTDRGLVPGCYDLGRYRTDRAFGSLIPKLGRYCTDPTFHLRVGSWVGTSPVILDRVIHCITSPAALCVLASVISTVINKQLKCAVKIRDKG